MKIDCKTGEIVNSLEQYYNTKHWENIIRSYIESNLSQKCFHCKKECIPSEFRHRTKTRFGHEKLTDIIPLCSNCFSFRNNRSKKKIERHHFGKFGFNSNHLSESKKHYLLSIDPKQRGLILSKYYSKILSGHNPSSTWINSQVKKACKWIKKHEKVSMQNF